jgi:protease I|tara:strand:+ start:732 stop:1271 length:540 start_codon:yes stop_codon:yes gene_type:complete
MKKALIITWEKFQDHEVIYPYHSLKENNFEVTIVANRLGRFHGILGCHMIGDVLTTDFDDPENRAKYLEYDLLIIPGGVKALEKLRLEEGIVEFVREWNGLDKTIFSLCNGAQLLITADVIKGKTVSGYYAIEADINNAGASYHRGPVVVDSNIVSSPHYDFMGEWMRTGYKVLEQRNK